MAKKLTTRDVKDILTACQGKTRREILALLTCDVVGTLRILSQDYEFEEGAAIVLDKLITDLTMR
jgi:hypothetical protein